MFHSSDKVIAKDSDIDEAFISMHQSIMTKIKSYVSEDWIVLDVIISKILTILSGGIREKNSIKIGDNKKFIAILRRLNLWF